MLNLDDSLLLLNAEKRNGFVFGSFFGSNEHKLSERNFYYESIYQIWVLVAWNWGYRMNSETRMYWSERMENSCSAA